MRSTLVVVVALVVAMAWTVALAAGEADIQVYKRDLSVFDEAGNKVDPSVAKATGIAPKSIGYGDAEGIKISACVTPVLRVHLSSTEIAWDVRRAGVYQTKAIDISTSEYFIDGVSKDMIPMPRITMNVRGAENLKLGPSINSSVRPIGTELPTYYALTSSSVRGVPKEYKDAKSFNGSHIIGPNTSIWNKINILNSDGGSYNDDFTVTFSRSL